MGEDRKWDIYNKYLNEKACFYYQTVLKGVHEEFAG